MKTCSKCKNDFDESFFHKNYKGKDGHNTWCKKCMGEYQKKRMDVPLDLQIKHRMDNFSEMKVNVLNIEDAAYIAGLMDGEGYIGVIRIHTNDPNRTSKYQLKIEICNNCIDVLQWLLITIGFGRIFKRSDSRASSWIILASRSIDFLKQIHPYLKIKRFQAEVAMKYAQTLMHGKKLTSEIIEKREELRSNIIELNSRYRSNNQVKLNFK